MIEGEWCVAVFKCRPSDMPRMLIDFYRFVKDVEGVKSVHFVVKDRLKSYVVFSFRMLVDSKAKNVVKSKVQYKLGTLMIGEQFAVDPEVKNPLRKYAAWSPDEIASKCGQKSFGDFCDFLSKISVLVLQMFRKNCFGSDARVEMTRAAAEMLGCTEYGLLSTEHWEVGYYDRIDDRYCPSLKRNFSEVQYGKQA